MRQDLISPRAQKQCGPAADPSESCLWQDGISLSCFDVVHGESVVAGSESALERPAGGGSEMTEFAEDFSDW